MHARNLFRKKLRLTISFAALLGLAPGAAAQTTPPAAHRRKIGIALEGGGALGFAHITVLKWLEEHKIPVDYIAGSSMGALVGGMYAMGHSPDEIQAMVTQVDPDQILSGETPYQELSFRLKEERRAYLNSLQFSLRSGFQLPSGLSTGQNINFILEKGALPYGILRSFDELPIPFRCVAMDLSNGQEKVFEGGSLSEAMRASMSIPGIFTPVTTKEGVYVDARLVDNLPTRVLQEMGADVIIAVHLHISDFKPGAPASALEVVANAEQAVIRANEDRSRKLAQVVIDVNLEGLTTLNFDKRDVIEERGRLAAGNAESLLASYKLEEPEWKAYLAERSKRVKTLENHPVRPAEIKVVREVPPQSADFGKQSSELNGDLRDEMEDRLAPFKNVLPDPEKLQKTLTALNSEKRFTRLEYHTFQEAGLDKLEVATQDPGYKVKRIRAGIALDGSQPDEILFSLGGGISFLDLGGLHSDLRVDVAAGSVYRVSTEYFHPFTPESRWFIAPHAKTSSAPLNLYSHSTQLSGYRLYQTGGGLDFGYSFGVNSEVRVGYDAGRLQDTLRVGNALLPQLSGLTGAASIRFRLDRVDDPIVPEQGVALETAFRWYEAYPGTTRGFPAGEFHFGAYHSFKRHESGMGRNRIPVKDYGNIFFSASGGSTFGYNSTGLPQFFLGGPERFSAYGSNELRTNEYLLFRAGYQHQLFKLPALLGRGVYATSAYEVGKVYSAPMVSRVPQDFVTGILANTIFGPAFVGASFGDSGHRKWFFQLGHIF
jgi:NTE family protein